MNDKQNRVSGILDSLESIKISKGSIDDVLMGTLVTIGHSAIKTHDASRAKQVLAHMTHLISPTVSTESYQSLVDVVNSNESNTIFSWVSKIIAGFKAKRATNTTEIKRAYQETIDKIDELISDIESSKVRFLNGEVNSEGLSVFCDTRTLFNPSMPTGNVGEDILPRLKKREQDIPRFEQYAKSLSLLETEFAQNLDISLLTSETPAWEEHASLMTKGLINHTGVIKLIDQMGKFIDEDINLARDQTRSDYDDSVFLNTILDLKRGLFTHALKDYDLYPLPKRVPAYPQENAVELLNNLKEVLVYEQNIPPSNLLNVGAFSNLLTSIPDDRKGSINDLITATLEVPIHLFGYGGTVKSVYDGLNTNTVLTGTTDTEVYLTWLYRSIY